MKYYEINEEAARRAKETYSFSDYIEGSETAEYRGYVDRCYKLVDSLPEELKEKGAAIADRYAKKLADWYNKKFSIDMCCPSIMIAGGSNFPVAKNQKQVAAMDRHYELWREIQAIPNKIKSLANGAHIIKAGEANAIEQLEEKVRKAEELQAEMKAVNAYYRKHKTLKGYKDYTDEKASKLDKAIKNSYYNVPFPPYELSNNNAKIKNTKKRIAELERLKNEAASGANEYDTDLFKIKENSEIMRLQLFFDGKPDVDVRAVLKKHGFKWSPSNEAWQRQLTDNARRSLKAVIEELSN